MKSLAPWVCILAAAATQTAFANEDFRAYRLGHYDKAYDLLLNKSENDAIADYYLGRLYLYGYGQLKNTDLAIRYFTKAAEKNYLPALLLMAQYSLFKEKNPEHAVRWYKQAASLNNVPSQLFMAAAYLYGFGVKQNVDVATHYYIDAAKNGDPIAQFALAENFIDSKHSGNAKLGLIWLGKSAASGNPKALTRLGALYIAGKIITKDEEKGIALLNQALEQNYAPAYIELAKAAIANKDYTKALDLLNKAANQKELSAYLEIAHLYLLENTPIYDPKSAFLWTLKAAQMGIPEAKTQLAHLYDKGIGVTADPALAQQWLSQAQADEKKKTKPDIAAQVALWLSNGKTDKLSQTSYQMKGILSPWFNSMGLRNNTYNQAPQMEYISRKDIFSPQFAFTQPNDVPINSYYDALISKTLANQDNQWTYPFYSLNPFVEALEKANSPVVAHDHLPVPYADADYYDQDDYSNASIMDIWTQGWWQHVNYMSVFNSMYNRAILGDAQSQFEIGQMFQYGIGVPQNDEAAIVFYQNAIQQLHLGAEYNLGILFLEHAKDKNDYQQAMNWLTDSAFKGNRKSQYVLARLLNQGKSGPNGEEYIPSNHEQAISMLYLSAANNYGPAQYDLAEHLARDYANALSVDVKKHRVALIRALYQGAVENGVAQALVPLAYYDAMDKDPVKQARAFRVAQERAEMGDDMAALLLGLLYDRGIGVQSNQEEAISWYQKAGVNPVSEFILGTYTLEGKGVEQDKDKGVEELKQAADSQFSYAYFNLAMVHHQNQEAFLPDLETAYKLGYSHAGIVLADYFLSEQSDSEKMNQARQIYAGLAEKGDEFAQLKLAYMLNKGLGTSKNPMEAERWYKASAMQGNAEAQYLLAQLYQVGELGEPDYNQAKHWYQKAAKELPKASVALGFIAETVDDNYAEALRNYQEAAERGDIIGSYDLGLMYEYGKGIPVDYAKAKAYFSEAANKGLDNAITQLANMYFFGLGESRNVEEALSLYNKAADLGNSNALYALGLMSETGVGISLDFANALKYYSDAANKGNEKAMLALARMYHYGLGVDKDTKMSASIYKKLADRQNAYAQYRLGTYYLEGIAGERIPDKGKQLLKQASDNGSPQAKKALERLDAKDQSKVSYLEPIEVPGELALKEQSPDMMYLDALNEWNHGDETLSRLILQQLVIQYPNFTPAKKIFEQLNQASLIRTYA